MVVLEMSINGIGTWAFLISCSLSAEQNAERNSFVGQDCLECVFSACVLFDERTCTTQTTKIMSKVFSKARNQGHAARSAISQMVAADIGFSPFVLFVTFVVVLTSRQTRPSTGAADCKIS